MQELWLIKVGWDDPLPMSTIRCWNEFREELSHVNLIAVPRWLQLDSTVSNIQVHGFADASNLAIGAVVYLRTEKPGTAPVISLVCAKTRVAPLKRRPYLTENGFTSAERTTQQTVPHGGYHRNNFITIHYGGMGHHGSFYLHIHWPVSSVGSTAAAALREKPSSAHPVVIGPQEGNELLERHNDLNKILRVTALVNRLGWRLRWIEVPDQRFATPAEVEEARLFWIKRIQHHHFHEEIRILVSGRKLPNTSPMSRLTPYLDHQQILWIGGWLHNAHLDFEEIHPAVVPRHSRFTDLLTLTFTRQRYWIIGGRAPVRTHIHQCVVCVRNRGELAQQLMGQLPPPRIQPSRPFTHTGVDFAGPLNILRWKGSGHRAQNGYISVFVCFSTSGIHFEAVTEYTSQEFIAAYKRFSGRRGIPASITSDRGLNFIGANRVLNQLFAQASAESDQIWAALAADGTT
ncbi:uncharacterized protein LOC135171377 [Diachasmimorpha longicaudata]|uniref:uncharacterized protein LOC135171377 n=1 Tax=Diachasmimorpha longicaudata TaxID=58733 RepID=UPI0030B8D8B0